MELTLTIFGSKDAAFSIGGQMLKVIFYGIFLFFLVFTSGCGGVLSSSEKYICKDSKGTLDDYSLVIQRSFFEKSNLMKIPSRVEVLGTDRNICSENAEMIWAGEDCRGENGENQSLVFSKRTLKLEINVTESIVRRASCALQQ